MCMSNNQVPDFNFLKHVFAYEIGNKGKEAPTLIITCVVHLEIQHWWEWPFLLLVFQKSSPKTLNGEISIMFHSPKGRISPHFLANCLIHETINICLFEVPSLWLSLAFAKICACLLKFFLPVMHFPE